MWVAVYQLSKQSPQGDKDLKCRQRNGEDEAICRKSPAGRLLGSVVTGFYFPKITVENCITAVQP